MSVSWNRNDEDVLPLRHLIVHVTVSLLCWAFIVLCGYVGYRLSFVI